MSLGANLGSTRGPLGVSTNEDHLGPKWVHGSIWDPFGSYLEPYMGLIWGPSGSHWVSCWGPFGRLFRAPVWAQMQLEYHAMSLISLAIHRDYSQACKGAY
jgi:hypothetical protein